MPCRPHEVPPEVRRAVADAVVDLRLSPPRGDGRTLHNWRVLARLGAAALDVARLVEAHLDAATIRHELGAPAPAAGSVWGVWAAGSRDDALVATAEGSVWRLDGTKPWCSGIGVCTHALVTAEAEDGPRLLAVDLASDGVTPAGGAWAGVGMRGSGTNRLRFDGVPAAPVGAVGAYLDRAGFWHGASGVAAAWFGGAAGAAAPLRAVVAAVDPPEPHAAAHLGTVDATIAAARAVLRAAAAEIEAGDDEGTGADGRAARTDVVAARRRALQVRAVVETAVETTLRATARATGPRPLALDGVHAQHVADLEVYVRQSHAERDLARLGALAAAAPTGEEPL